MRSLAILIDFGSTFTKVTAVDLAHARVVGRSQAPSTVRTDVREGLLEALMVLHERHRTFAVVPRDLQVLDEHLVLASSSAAGGLRIAVVGLVPGLTVEAASQAALGAGAKIIASTAFKLTGEALRAIERLDPDMLLLTGGTDGGDSATVVHNARALAQSSLSAPVLFAGNQAAAARVRELLETGGNEVRSAENVMPKAGLLAVESAREEIRKLFMERITRAKGLDGIRPWVDIVFPTPMAVLEAVRLGADGCGVGGDAGGNQGWGDMVVVDVGGATTDVHSIGHGLPAGENVIARGLAEAYAKRTVEGDLGIRYNAETILTRVGLEGLLQLLREDFRESAQVSAEELLSYIQWVSQCTDSLPGKRWHAAADAVLARAAVNIAIERHAGRRERVVAREGEAWVHYGKDLRETPTLVGTGGVFVHNPFAAYILNQPLPTDGSTQSLRPRRPRLFLDSSYLLYAVGLLARKHPGIALQIFKDSITPVA